MGKVYVSNAFSLNMLRIPHGSVVVLNLVVSDMTPERFCAELKAAEEVVSAIGHEGTAQLLNRLCGTSFQATRAQIQLDVGDYLYLLQVGFRLPEGAVLSEEQLRELHKQGLLRFLKLFYNVYLVY